jgi:putative hydrolase of the HAD superfamily
MKEVDMTAQTNACNIDVVIFDFGGVLAEKGFEEGLRSIAARNRLVETDFYNLALGFIHTTGYLTGHADEHMYWQAIRDKTGIREEDTVLRNDILSRFILRPWMFHMVKELKASGVGVVILSDQTNWLDELNDKHDFFKLFDVVFNSYHLGMSKVDPSHFTDTISRLGSTPEKLLFIDDTGAHCDTARRSGIHAIQYIDRESFIKEMRRFFPFL